MTEITPFSSATDLAAAVKARKVSSVELVEMYRARINTHNPALNAVVFTDWARTLAAARDCDDALARGEVRGALHGVPMTVKEAFDMEGSPSTWGMPALKDNIPLHDAAGVARLKAAGAVIMGKTNVPFMVADHQTFNPVYGTTNNPWNLAHTPGGSSGGAAAALAAGLTALEFGSDIAGSIRHPAHCCGVYGHKPTFGVVVTRGHDMPGDLVPLDMGVVGPMARSARDLNLGLSVLAGPAQPEAAGWQLSLPAASLRDFRGLRIGVVTNDDAAPVDGEVRSAIERLADFLESRGATVTRNVRPVRDTQDAFATFTRLLRSATLLHIADADIKAAIDLAATLTPGTTGYAAETAFGRSLSHRDWMRFNERRHRIKQEWTSFFDSYDILLCPASCRAASPHDQITPRPERTVMIDGKAMPGTNDLFWAGLIGMVHLPSTTAPIGMTSDNLPVGVQIVGSWYRDRSTIAFAELLEREYRAFVAPQAFA